jgi:hypothetical protein
VGTGNVGGGISVVFHFSVFCGDGVLGGTTT